MAASLGQEFCTLRDTYIEKQFGRLNDMQRQAVFTTDGPLLILAGAGSGKTTVLVNRIANLIRFGSAHGSKETPRPVTEEDVKALRTAIMTGTDAPSWLDGMLRQNAVRSWNVMAITFTNKAAGELKERLRRMLGGEEGDEVFASTFHSACVRILRRWAEEIGYPRSFTIYDTDDAQRVMKTVYKELSIDDKFLPIKAAINQMSRWKDQLVSPEQALADHARDVKSAHAALWRVLRKSRFDDGSPLVQFFRLDLSGEWAAFIEASKELAELVIDGKPDGTGFGTDEETERLESLRKPFLSLLAKAQEES